MCSSDLTGAMLLLVYTVVAAQQAGWASARTIGSFAAVAAALAGFAASERRSADPLVPLGSSPDTRTRTGQAGMRPTLSKSRPERSISPPPRPVLTARPFP